MHGAAGPEARRDGGFALVVVLWGLVLISVIAGRVGAAGRSESLVARNLQDEALVETAADAAIYQGIYHLLAPGDEHWPSSGRRIIEVGPVQVVVTLGNLADRVNPNTATPELLRELLVALDVAAPRAAALADAITLWREGSRAASPANVVTRAAGIGEMDDLLAVPGMSAALLERLRPHLTLWWEDDPNPASSDPIVMTAMRALGDMRPRSPGAERPRRAVGMVARATGAKGVTFTRHADVVVDPMTLAQPWRIVTWDRDGG